MKNLVLITQLVVFCQSMFGQTPNISYVNYSSNYCTNVKMLPVDITSAGGVVVPVVTTLAGSSGGYSDGQDTAAKFLYPSGICTDKNGTIFIADQGNNRIRKITPTGLVTTVAGSTLGFKDSNGVNAKFYGPACLVADTLGNLFVSDYYNHRIRKITPSGVVTTFAGSTIGFVNDTGTKAKFNGPSGIVFDKDGNLVVVEQGNHRMRRITSGGVVSFYAGSVQGIANGLGAAAKFSEPFGLVKDINDNFLVADLTNQRIRMIDSAGMVTTVAGSIQGYLDGNGSNSQFFLPTALMIDHKGFAYVADLYNHRIRKMSLTYEVSTIAGSGVPGYKDSVGEAARFNGPAGLATSQDGVIYVVDQLNHLVRKMVTYTISPQLPAGLTFNRTTGNISGTPTQVTPLTSYVVTGKNLFGTDTATITFSTGQFVPTVNANQQFCNLGYVGDIYAVGTGIRWYDTTMGGTPLSLSDTLVNGKTYYATQTLAGCESKDRAPVTATINVIPTPTGIDSQIICNFGFVSDLIANGSNLKWYDSLTGGSPISKSAALIHGKVYFASQTVGGCESIGRFALRVKIIVTNAPTGPAAQNFCSNTSLTSLTVNGVNVKWYDTISGGTALAPFTPLVNGKTYYATQNVNACESYNRLSVTATLNIVGAPTGSSTQTFCNFAKVNELTAVGTSIIWFDTVMGGVALDPNSSLTNGKTYYAAQVINFCPSTVRLPVNVVINYIMPPTGNPIQGYCNLAKISDIQVSGSQIKWYSSSTSLLPLDSSTLLGPGSTYYATQTIGGCTSPLRLAVTITIAKTPAPLGVIQQSFCHQASLSQLTAIGDNILWYDTSFGGTPLSPSILLQNGKKYYASRTVTGCESLLRLGVTAYIIVPDTAIIPIFNGLSARFNGSLFQWRDCDNNLDSIPGATERTFYPTKEGNYALEVTHLGCTGISSCVSYKFATSSILTKEGLGSANIYPNPINKYFNIRLDHSYEAVLLEIFNVEGQLITQKWYDQVQQLYSELNGNSGIYFIRLSDKLGNEAKFKVVKE